MTQEELNAKAASTLTEKQSKLELVLSQPIWFFDWKPPFIHRKSTISYTLRPATLGKLQMIAERILPLGIDTEAVQADPVAECLKIVEKNSLKLAEVMAIIITDDKNKLKDRVYIEKKAKFVHEQFSISDLAFALAIFITTIDYAGFYSVLRLKKILDFKNTNRRTTPSIVEKLKDLQSGENSQG